MKETYEFANVPEPSAFTAFRFHEKIAKNNGHIWPRTSEDIQKYAHEGALFGVRQQKTGELVGICYVVFDEDLDAWEIGGLAVEESAQKLGVGTALTRMALVTSIALEFTEFDENKIIAHVHESNDRPRKLFKSLGFDFVQQVVIPNDVVPHSMKRNQDGDMVGDRFRFSFDGLKKLHVWLRQCPGGSFHLGKSEANAQLNFGPFFSHETVLAAISALVDDYKKKQP